jgi:hypothetical protein
VFSLRVWIKLAQLWSEDLILLDFLSIEQSACFPNYGG